MRFYSEARREQPEINLIAFIDVLLVVLIFLMVTTTYNQHTELKIDLPKAQAEQTTEQNLLIDVMVDAQSRYAINNTRIVFHDVAGLSEDLQKAVLGQKKSANDEPVIVISADAAAPHQAVINVMEAARLAGFAKIAFNTEKH